MEEDVEPEDEDGVDGRGGSGWDGWVCGLGAVVDSPIFGLVRRTGVFLQNVDPTYYLVRVSLSNPFFWKSKLEPEPGQVRGSCLEKKGCLPSLVETPWTGLRPPRTDDLSPRKSPQQTCLVATTYVWC
jgi:hypothetical protein